MITTKPFAYKPGEHEAERASNAYLMSLVAVVAGLPLPIVNVIASFGFWLGNRSSSYFVRWHCMQALFGQLALIPFNSFIFWWTIKIIFYHESFSLNYGIALASILVLNLFEFIGTIYSAVETRKGKHVEWWFYSDLAHQFCKA